MSLAAPPRDGPGTRPFAKAPAWFESAVCRGCTELFFEPYRERPEQRKFREAAARAMCLSCPVREPCRSFARREREYGLWGGETEQERVAAGYPVAFPVGRVARTARLMRTAGGTI